MAQKKSQTSTQTTVRRITAKDEDAPKRSARPVKPKATAKAPARTKKVGYFKGAWQELQQVRWPTRSATWSMTLAVIAFTVLMAVIILLLDAGFNWLSSQILK